MTLSEDYKIDGNIRTRKGWICTVSRWEARNALYYPNATRQTIKTSLNYSRAQLPSWENRAWFRPKSSQKWSKELSFEKGRSLCYRRAQCNSEVIESRTWKETGVQQKNKNRTGDQKKETPEMRNSSTQNQIEWLLDIQRETVNQSRPVRTTTGRIYSRTGENARLSVKQCDCFHH